MSSSILRPVTCSVSPVTRANGSNWERPKVKLMQEQALPHLQVTGNEKPLFQQSITSTSRREMMHLTAASLGLAYLLLPPPAEARWARNAGMREKIMQKLENLRQEALKPKDETEEKKPNEGTEARKAKVNNETVETKLKLKEGELIEKPLAPSLPYILAVKTLEIALP